MACKRSTGRRPTMAATSEMTFSLHRSELQEHGQPLPTPPARMQPDRGLGRGRLPDHLDQQPRIPQGACVILKRIRPAVKGHLQAIPLKGALEPAATKISAGDGERRIRLLPGKA